MIGRKGVSYDLKNVFDLGRSFIRTPVPGSMKRRMRGPSRGEPTRGVCSTRLAEAFDYRAVVWESRR